MISKTQIKNRTKKKTNPELVETIEIARKNNLLDLAKKLSAPSSQQKIINVDELSKLNENKIVVVGKILGSGEINKKISVAALAVSEQAKEKLKKAGCEVKTIKQEIESNSKLNGVKII